jgi:hypothetical protein
MSWRLASFSGIAQPTGAAREAAPLIVEPHRGPPVLIDDRVRNVAGPELRWAAILFALTRRVTAAEDTWPGTIASPMADVAEIMGGDGPWS